MAPDEVKITAINGSHRSDKGFTEIVLRKFLAGAESAGARCEVLYPSKLKITPCESCGKCLFETPGVCKFNDDMKAVIPQIEEADLLVWACPVYFDSMPSNLKKMIERLRCTLDAYFEFREGRTYHLKTRENDQSAVAIFTAGNPERDSFFSISRVLNRILDNMGCRLVGEFLFPASHLLITEPERLAPQLEAVAAAGSQFALRRKINKTTQEEANGQYIDDPARTLQQMTRMILEMRGENAAHSSAANRR